MSISRGNAIRAAAVLMLVAMMALPVTSAYLNENIDMTDHVVEQSCYCHGPLPVPEVDIVIDVPTQVAYTPDNRTVEVSIGVLGTPENLTGFGLFLNASEDDSGVRWTKRFSNGTIDVGDGTIQGI
ncbi:MAG: hypothetical protein GWN39_12490, partial [Thermoplasmata archaeon]|nr:hypothetical protein [Thermoplasmata archaeon]NIT78177.1 hypothetical protein [Thermoplasmata archaeon]NIU49839.1 hypothetical protein [Thermoplasmata archaeon]NIV79530.1 hypothetical protein [Thermoplasmata archaeon]NIY04547.1 hypothetical protein [Thermoplasmata archaeon]